MKINQTSSVSSCRRLGLPAAVGAISVTSGYVVWSSAAMTSAGKFDWHLEGLPVMHSDRHLLNCVLQIIL